MKEFRAGPFHVIRQNPELMIELPFTYTLLLGAFALGVITGSAITCLILIPRSAKRLALFQQEFQYSLNQQLLQRDQEIARLRDLLTEASAAQAAAQASLIATEKLLLEQREQHQTALRQSRQDHEQALAYLRESFKALSADALRQSHPEFLRLAQETLAKFQETAKGDLQNRQQSIETLLKPLEEQLKNYQHRLAQSETQQAGTLGELKKQIETLSLQNKSLSTETLQLRRILSSNQARGRWGEETLRRIVETAGMSPHCDFNEQIHSGEAKPDLLVRLPGNRLIIIDSKVPELDFLASLENAQETRRAEALTLFATKLKNTIKALADRNYAGQFPNALDYVILFVPAESLFSAALEGDPNLIVWAGTKGILLATPTSLLAILRAVSITWQQHNQTENARAIASAAQELYARVCTFAGHFEKIRSGLERAGMAVNDAIGSYSRLVRPSGERLAKLGGGANKELPEIEAVDFNWQGNERQLQQEKRQP